MDNNDERDRAIDNGLGAALDNYFGGRISHDKIAVECTGDLQWNVAVYFSDGPDLRNQDFAYDALTGELYEI